MMTKDKPPPNEMFAGYTLTSGAVRARDLAYLLGTDTRSVDEGTPRSRVFVRDRGRWIPPVDLNWNARSCTICHAPAERFLAMSEQGYVLALGGGDVVVEPRIADGSDIPGPLTEIREIAGKRAFAVGTLRQCYVRQAPGRWERIDETCRATGRGAADFGFMSIDGFSATEIYATGWEGEIWGFDGETWSRKETPTNLALYRVCCAGDGFVYAVGQRGTILRGRGDRWVDVPHEGTELDIWGCEWFQDRLVVATVHSLFDLGENTLAPVVFGSAPPPASCLHLSAADGVLWSIGTHDVLQLDASGWSAIVPPYDG